MATKLHEQALGNANVQNFLRMLATAEGTLKNGADPYRVGFGGSQIADLSAHPNIVKSFRQTDGKMNKTSAAGAYQFLNKTWTPLQQQLGLKDFSPRSQDIAAIELIKQAGALDDITRGNYGNAIKKTGRIWASLPSSPYAQPKRSSSFIEKALGISSAHAGTLPPQPMKPQKDKWNALVEEFSTPQQAPQQAGQGAPAQQPMQQQAAPQADKWDALVKEFSAPPQPAPNQAPVAPASVSKPVQAAPRQQAQASPQRNSFATSMNTLVPILGLIALLEKKSGDTTAAGKTAMGAMDPAHGGAQTLSKSVPSFIEEPVNRLNNWIADNTGLTARLPEGGVDQQVRERESAYQARRKAAGESGFDGWRTTGNVISPVNIALGAAGGAQTAGANIVRGATTGAVSAGFNPVTNGDFWSEKGKQVATGAAFGAAVPAITHSMGRVISPNASRNPKLQMLRKEGVKPTIGQTLGGAWNSVEEKATSIPIVGDMISRQRRSALKQFNNAAINRAGAPIGARVKGAGVDAVAEIGDMASAAQENAKNMIGAFQIDDQASATLSKIESMARGIPDKHARSSVTKAINLVKTQASERGVMTPDSYKEVVSNIGKDAAYLSGSSNGYQRKAGDALTEIVETLRAAGLRQNPAASKAMSNADQAWANLVRVEGASKAAANNGGVFTPAQLMAAVRQADTSVRDRATARGTALMQDLADAGQSVLGNKVPNSFTTDRLLVGAGALGTGAGFGLGAPTAAGLLGGAGLYTDPVQRLLSGAVSARPHSAKTIRDAIVKASPGLVPLGSQIGLGLLYGPTP